MTLLLGIDTGGTFTDAVLMTEGSQDAQHEVIAKAKSPTTHHDLSVGIAGALDGVLTAIENSNQIGLVSLSTTLATNALVEGRGGRICLILIGFDEGALSRAGLAEALGSDPVVFLAGGHGPSGQRQAQLDRTGLADAASTYANQVDAFAVVAHFGTRDPVDELAARDLLQEASGLPITCGHDLASELGGPKRAVTAVLNARLIGMIAELLRATEEALTARGVHAPVMLVRGDGSLVSTAFARNRPIETILSGPAASLVGAAYLSGEKNAIVSDIGGTTTDIAVLRDGRPALSAQGASVGGHRTMVGAVDMATHGLGGDSEVHVDDSSLTPRLVLGPRRVRPITTLALEFAQLVHTALDESLARPTPSPHDGRFVLRIAGRSSAGLREGDLALLDQISVTPQPASTILKTRLREAALGRLIGRGLVLVSAFTPTDASHVLRTYTTGDPAAAEKAASLMARRRDAGGRPVAETPRAFAELVRRTLVHRSAEVLLDAAFAHDGFEAQALSATALPKAALAGHNGAARVSIGLALPLIGLGASAGLYYPAIAERLGTDPIVPPDADVANAIGAVVGQVRLVVEASVTQPSDGRFTVHLPQTTMHFSDSETAKIQALTALRRLAAKHADFAGAAHVDLTEHWEAKTVPIEGREVFVEARARVVATGRPQIATA
ncbi:MAG: hydantoinase/oxoprolinase family protein [Pseudomonadota bacterium]